MTVLDILASTEIHRFNSARLLATNDAYLCISHLIHSSWNGQRGEDDGYDGS